MTALRVLHVDDEPDIREVVGFSLSLDPDFEIKSCASGAEALVVAGDWAPHIIILDVMLPGMDGPSILTSLRDNAKTAAVPVVFMTARAQSREIDQFRSLGAAGVISKPFDPMSLAAWVRAYISPVANALDGLRAIFLRRVDDDAAVLAVHRSALKGGNAPADSLTKIRDIAHGLAGAGGIFGFSDISHSAAELENAIRLDGSGSMAAIVNAFERLLISLETRAVRPDVSYRV